MQADLKGSDKAKFLAAQKASRLVENGMKVGLGTGSTAVFLVNLLGERVKSVGLQIDCVATSTSTADQARGLGIKIHDLDDLGQLDLAIDGADEIDPQFNLIKGAGGALLQEKIVASAADRMIVIADESKVVERLGKFALPVEVVPFGMKSTARMIAELLMRVDVQSTKMALRMAGDAPYVTDCGNHIYDLSLGYIDNPRQLAAGLTLIPGVIESGLFIGLCDTVIIGHTDGGTQVRERGGAAENMFADDAR
ncbi:MAG: ribose-5-phosphate isomerase RpiA [Deltaproteobacteria bacterium]